MKTGARAYTAAEKADFLERFITLTQGGKSKREASEELGINTSTLLYWRNIVERGDELTDSVHHHVNKNPAARSHGEYPLATKQEAVALFTSGKMTQRRIAKRYKINVSTLSKWVRDAKHGILTGSRGKETQTAPAQLSLEAAAAPARAAKNSAQRPPAPPPAPPAPHAPVPASAPAALSAEQVELAMLRAENARLKRALDAVISTR